MLLSIIIGLLSALWFIILFFLLFSDRDWNEDPFATTNWPDDLDDELFRRTGKKD